MILEIAQIDVKSGMEQAFEEGVAKAAPLFRRAKGCVSMELQRSIEKPNRYRLMVGWQTLENHTVDFREIARLPALARIGRPVFRDASRSRAYTTGSEGILKTTNWISLQCATAISAVLEAGGFQQVRFKRKLDRLLQLRRKVERLGEHQVAMGLGGRRGLRG